MNESDIVSVAVIVASPDRHIMQNNIITRTYLYLSVSMPFEGVLWALRTIWREPRGGSSRTRVPVIVPTEFLGEIESMNYGTVAPPTIEQEQKSVNEVMRVLVITPYQVDPEVLN